MDPAFETAVRTPASTRRPATPNELRSQLRPVTSAGNETDTDLALFLQGYITLTLLDGDLGVRDGAAADAVISRLSNLALPQPASLR